MLKIIGVILMLVIGILIDEHFYADVPDYTQPFKVAHWSMVLTVGFLIHGVIKLENNK